jgi:hypothetical protein
MARDHDAVNRTSLLLPCPLPDWKLSCHMHPLLIGSLCSACALIELVCVHVGIRCVCSF